MRRVLLALVAVFFLCPVAWAGQFGIVAEVDDRIVTNYDLKNRIDIIVHSANLPNNQATKEKLMPQALQTLINERLQQMEGERLEISVSDNELSRAIAELESQNKIPKGGFYNFVQQQGLSKSAVTEQIRGQILWQKIVAKTITPKIKVTNDEIADAIRQIGKQPQNREVELYEIVLPIDSGDAEARKLANELYDQLIKGANFGKLAKQFSSSPTAPDGGKIGWIAEEQLKEDVRDRVKKAGAGEIVRPFKSEDTYRLLLVKQAKGLSPAPEEGRVRQYIMIRKIEREARGYLQKLRKEAFINIRL